MISCRLYCFVNAALSFINVYRLKGDNVSLKKSVCDHFIPEDQKKVLWDHCKYDLEAAGLVYTTLFRQISPSLDIILAFLVIRSYIPSRSLM